MYSWSVNVSKDGVFYCSIDLRICSEQIAWEKYQELQSIFPDNYELYLYRNVSYSEIVS